MNGFAMNGFLHDYLFQDIVFFFALYKLYGAFLTISPAPRPAFLKAAGSLLGAVVLINLILTGRTATAFKLVIIFLGFNMLRVKIAGVQERRRPKPAKSLAKSLPDLQ